LTRISKYCPKKGAPPLKSRNSVLKYKLLGCLRGPRIINLLEFKEEKVSYTFGRNVLLSSVGFDRLIDAIEEMSTRETLNKAQSYPPYNIIKQNERDYAIEIAVAGFKNDEIDITAEGNKLTVLGKVKTEQTGEYLHKGIANRDFSHNFTLAETIIVRSADIKNGLLIIKLENVIPEEKLPRKILIGGNSKLVFEEVKEAA
jgi:molecular chaperone IbpA